MGLTEEQIVRYSRQILLPEVGGRGQERLLEAGVRLCGRGPAQDCAEVYLAAGGSTVGAEGEGALGEWPARFTGAAPWVALGENDGCGWVVYRSTEGCPECFAARCSALAGGVPCGLEDLVGAVGALVYQRAVLGRSEADGALSVDQDGRVARAQLPRCGAHG
jgi:hypothetical protein